MSVNGTWRTWPFLVALLVGACGSSGQTVVDKPMSERSTTTAERSTPTAAVGDTLTLEGMDDGAQADVTLVRIVDPAQPESEYFKAQKGRFVAVQVKITNTGSVTYEDSPDNGAELVDDQSQRFDAEPYRIADCQYIGSSVKIAPGDSVLGCMTFDLPVASKLARFQFTLDSGFADTTGKWLLS